MLVTLAFITEQVRCMISWLDKCSCLPWLAFGQIYDWDILHYLLPPKKLFKCHTGKCQTLPIPEGNGVSQCPAE